MKQLVRFIMVIFISFYTLISIAQDEIETEDTNPTYAYIVNSGTGSTGSSSVTQCNIDVTPGATQGHLYNCQVTGGGNAFGPIGIGFTTVGTTKYNYVTKSNFLTSGGTGRLNLCGVSSTGSLGPCTQTGNVTGTFFTGIAFNTTSSNNQFAYITDSATGAILQCPVIDSNNGFIPACTNALSNIKSPQFITMQSWGGTTYAYIATANNTIWAYNNMQVCKVNSNDGKLTNCLIAVSPFIGMNTKQVAFSTVGSTNYAYITTPKGIYTCGVNTSNGTLSGCLIKGNYPLQGPQGIVKTTINGTQYVYATGISSDTVMVCSVNTSSGSSKGTLTCSDSGVGSIFVNPIGIAVQ